MTKAQFAGPMSLLMRTFPNTNLPDKAAKERTDAYFEVLGERLDEIAWRSVVTEAMREWTPRFYGDFPSPAQLLGFIEPARSLSAAEMFQRVLECNQYSPQEGGYWTAEHVREMLGPAAEEAFTACGGNAAIQRMTDRERPWVRKAFIDTYQAAVRRNPLLMLPEASAAGLARVLLK